MRKLGTFEKSPLSVSIMTGKHGGQAVCMFIFQERVLEAASVDSLCISGLELHFQTTQCVGP